MCVIFYTNINGQMILAKNRDRAYKPDIEIIHEIIDGLEVLYIHDKITGWMEGMNENGYAMVNSTLNEKVKNKYNEKQSVTDYRRHILKKKKNKMYHALIQQTKESFFDALLKPSPEEYLLEGHTLAVYDNQLYHIENNIQNDYVVKKIKNTHKNVVFSNHGMYLHNEGYQKGKKGMSSFLRRKIIEHEVAQLASRSLSRSLCDQQALYDDLSHILNKNYTNIDPRFHPYRDKETTKHLLESLPHHERTNQRIIYTTGQLICNVTNKEFVYYHDTKNSGTVEYINRLPTHYIPRLRLILKDTQKNLSPCTLFSRSYLNRIYERFHYNQLYRFHPKRSNHTKRRVGKQAKCKTRNQTFRRTRTNIS